MGACSTTETRVWSLLSPLIGWGYFFAWSASFYPQVVLNYQRQSVEGLSLDFLFLNLWGFLCYSTYNVGLYWDESAQNSVRLNDVVFAVHALALTVVAAIQSLIYHRSPSQRVSTVTKAFIAATGISATILSVHGSVEHNAVLYFLSYVKMIITLVKYVPQAYLNYTRKSTVGWSITNILLDLTGGVLSMSQSLIDAAVCDDWFPITKNPVKFGLGFISMTFDGFFLLQHYVLYVGGDRQAAGEDEEETGGLISGESSTPQYNSTNDTSI